jgi:hypothetical protein
MPRHRIDPRTSLSKLGEYLVAPPGRRRNIIQDQKNPKAFIVANYREAYGPLAECLVAGGDPRFLDRHLHKWRTQPLRSDFDARCRPLCIEAAEAFQVLLAAGRLSHLTFATGIEKASLMIGGVEVSISPDVLVAGPEAGAAKIYLSKTGPLTKDVGKRPGSSSYAATTLHQWVEHELGGGDPAKCLVIDVFADEVYAAPRSNVQRRRDVESACREIAAVWPTIPAVTVAGRP